MAKVKVRYMGSSDAALLSSDPSIPSIQFNRYGQLVEMDEDVFKGLISGRYGVRNIGVLLDEDFQRLGHTDAELTKYANPTTHASAPVEFKEKVKAANARLLELHAAADDRVEVQDIPQEKE